MVLMALLGFAPVIVLGKVTGSISGTVRDSSGAVMPGVKVEAVNIQTGVAQMTQSDSAGFYNFPALAIGHYNISFRKGGFQGYQEKDLMIDVDTALRVDPVLQVGATKQEVTVTGAASPWDCSNLVEKCPAYKKEDCDFIMNVFNDNARSEIYGCYLTKFNRGQPDGGTNCKADFDDCVSDPAHMP